jgi:hypothetical protein
MVQLDTEELDSKWNIVDTLDLSEWCIPHDERHVGLLVLICGVPGCGKDALGRKCAESFPTAAALSQDEHGGDASRALSSAEAMMHSGRSPLFILRNGVDAADRAPYVAAARRHNYRVVAVWPSELSSDEMHRKAALYLAAIAGCYGRLTCGGRSGHETLTVSRDMLKPAQVCLSFLRSFRAPSAPGEVDSVFAMPFLKQNDVEDVHFVDGALSEDYISTVVTQMKKDKAAVPKIVASCFAGTLPQVQAQLQPFATLRRSLPELIEDLHLWIIAELPTVAANSDHEVPWPAAAPAAPPSKEETRRLQREVKVRSALEHLVSPANIEACRASGTTVTNCVWLFPPGCNVRTRPAWPVSHFCGAPQLKRLCVTEDEIFKAAHTSTSANDSLQQGASGVRIEVVRGESDVLLLSPIEQLPGICLRKLRCPHVQSGM